MHEKKIGSILAGATLLAFCGASFSKDQDDSVAKGLIAMPLSLNNALIKASPAPTRAIDLAAYNSPRPTFKTTGYLEYVGERTLGTNSSVGTSELRDMKFDFCRLHETADIRSPSIALICVWGDKSFSLSNKIQLPQPGTTIKCEVVSHPTRLGSNIPKDIQLNPVFYSGIRAEEADIKAFNENFPGENTILLTNNKWVASLPK